MSFERVFFLTIPFRALYEHVIILSRWNATKPGEAPSLVQGHEQDSKHGVINGIWPAVYRRIGALLVFGD